LAAPLPRALNSGIGAATRSTTGADKWTGLFGSEEKQTQTCVAVQWANPCSFSSTQAEQSKALYYPRHNQKYALQFLKKFRPPCRKENVLFVFKTASDGQISFIGYKDALAHSVIISP
jgi:hypothetical protein